MRTISSSVRARIRTVVSAVVLAAGIAAVVPVRAARAEGSAGNSTVFAPLQDRIAVGGQHACAVTDVGYVSCWGEASSGQLGYGNTNDIGDDELPSQNPGGQAGLLAPIGPAFPVHITAGFADTCVLGITGEVQCWGANDHGQLGLGNKNNVGDNETLDSLPNPTVDLPDHLSAISIAAGDSFTCAVLSDGSVTCWGDATLGALGYGNLNDIGDNETPANNPVNKGRVPMPGGHLAKEVVAGAHFACALMDNDGVVCWGDNTHGQLGYGNVKSIGDNETPAQNAVNNGFVKFLNTGRTDVIALAAGGNSVCAILVGGSLRCWGQGSSGQLGYGNVNDIGDNELPSANPVNGGVVPLPGGAGAIAVAVGTSHACAILSSYRLTCWGHGALGALGYGNTNTIGDNETPAQNPVSGGLVSLPGGARVRAVAAGNDETCVVLEDSGNACWGQGSSGRLGYGNTNSIGDDETPAQNPVGNGRLSLVGFGLPTTSSQTVVPLSPARLLDTRPGQTTSDGQFEGGGALVGGSELALAVAGRGGVSPDSSGVMLTVTVTEPVAAGYVTAYPCGTPRPLASNINFSAGETIANSAAVQLGGGAVCLFANVTTHLVVDVTADFPEASGLVPLVPARLADTRAGHSTVDGQVAGGGALQAGQSLVVPIERGGVPHGARLVVLNVVAADAKGDGYLTVHPCDEAPTTSSLNFVAGETIANQVVMINPTSSGQQGKLCIFASATTDVVVDVQAAEDPFDDFLLSFGATRLVDTRPGGTTEFGTTPADSTPVPGGSVYHVPALAPLTGLTVMNVNLTITEPQAPGYATIFPCDQQPPTASNINYTAGETIAVNTLAKLGADGTLCIFTQSTAHIVLDATAIGF